MQTTIPRPANDRAVSSAWTGVSRTVFDARVELVAVMTNGISLLAELPAQSKTRRGCNHDKALPRQKRSNANFLQIAPFCT
jgi:hypothetical protein